MALALYRYRRFVWQRAWLEFRYRYAGTGLGAAWSVFHPLAIIAVYSIIFGVLLRRVFADVSVPYPIFLCAGLLPWLGFCECIARGCATFRANAAYLKRLHVPEELFVAQTALTATLNLTVGLSVLMVVSLIFGLRPTWHWLLLPVPCAMLLATGFGLGLAAGTLNVFFPDIHEVVPILLRLAMWAAPVIFPVSFYIDHGFGVVLALNPATAPITAVRSLFLDGQLPAVTVWLAMFAWVALSWGLGAVVLRSLRGELRDLL